MPERNMPSREDIARRAYELYLERKHSNEIDDWMRAERELIEKLASPMKKRKPRTKL